MYSKLVCFLLSLITEFCSALQEGEAGDASIIIHDGNGVVVMKGRVKASSDEHRSSDATTEVLFAATPLRDEF